MYRYSVDNAVTYTSEDFVLFRESPFACWMERLTLENPDHEIPPDAGSDMPQDTQQPQDDIASTLRGEGRDVAAIAWDMAEPQRRMATLDAMRKGVDFIVNGQLALGPLSGSSNLLMRTSGYSELGDYLYIPCATQGKTTLNSAFRLCFLADLLHSLQGQLPPQMLIIRSGADVLPLQTEDHIYHFRAVKQRFMTTMREFRKHRMPDPAESSHFGRWSDCANEVLKQRALREAEQQPQDNADEEVHAQPVQLAASRAQGASPLEVNAEAVELTATTLAEQALKLTPGTYNNGAGRGWTGSTPNLERALAESPEPAAAPSQRGPEGADVALENLEFIGSSTQRRRDTVANPEPKPEPKPEPRPAAPPGAGLADSLPAAQEPVADLEVPLAPAAEKPQSPELKPHPLDSAGFNVSAEPMVDRDINTAATSPTLDTADDAPGQKPPVDDWRPDQECRENGFADSDEPPLMAPFSDSLITNEGDIPRDEDA